MRQRVVYVSATDELGGADASLFELVRSLDRERWDPHVVVPHDGPFADRYRRMLVPVHVVPLKKLKNTRDPRWHAAWLAKAPLRVWRLLRLFARLQRPGRHVSTREAIALLEREPELAAINAHLRHKAGNVRSVQLDEAIVAAQRRTGG